MIFRVLFVLLALATAGIAAPPESLSQNEKAAFQTIAKAPQFCSDAVGYAGHKPEVVSAFQVILRSPQADVAFKQLFKDATPAGQLYALCGIYYTDAAYFDQAVQPYRTSRKSVKTLIGCVKSAEETRAIVEKTGPDVVRLKSRKETIEEWTKDAHHETMCFDIVGGGWPATFASGGR